MLKKLQYFWQLSYQRSPQENLEALRNKLDARLNPNKQQVGDHQRLDEANTVITDLWNQSSSQEFIAHQLQLHKQPIVLLGKLEETKILGALLVKKNIQVNTLEWDWQDQINFNGLPEDLLFVICHIPLSESQWKILQQLKEKYLNRLTSIYELVLPFTLLPMAQSSLDYYVKDLAEITSYYLGETYFRPLDQLNDVFPLVEKRVIEFGPLEGCLTAGLVKLGVKSLTCIEARPENAIKTLVACHSFGWKHVELVMDDFHNVNHLKYGAYDLVFAHGVYYHSLAPFLFLENLCSLSENIFIGGFCATDSLPEGDYERLEYGGKKYRTKMHKEVDYFTSGVNPIGYFFHKDDLMNFFQERNYEIIVLSDEDAEIVAGNYLRFLARKK